MIKLEEPKFKGSKRTLSRYVEKRQEVEMNSKTNRTNNNNYLEKIALWETVRDLHG